MSRRWGAFLGALAVALMATAAVAQEQDESTRRAKELFSDAKNAYEHGDFASALRGFEEAFLARPLAAFQFNIGQCHRELANHAQAARAYRRYLAAAPNAANRAEAERLIAEEEQAANRPAPVDSSAASAPPKVGQTDVPRLPLRDVDWAPPASAPRDVSRSSRLWIWGVVGGVAVAAVAVGVGLGVGLRTDSPASPTTWVFISEALSHDHALLNATMQPLVRF